MLNTKDECNLEPIQNWFFHAQNILPIAKLRMPHVLNKLGDAKEQIGQ